MPDVADETTGDGSSGADNPFGSMPFVSDLLKLISTAGPIGANHSRQIARSLASGGQFEPNIEPADRIAIEQLMRVAELRVADATGLPVAHGTTLRVETVTRSGWADRTIDDYSELFKAFREVGVPDPGIAQGSGSSAGPGPTPDDDPMAAMFAEIGNMLVPVLAAMATGSMVGRLAQNALGGFELPLPRPVTAPLLVLLPNVDRFGAEWSLDPSDLRLWICLHEVTHHAVLGIEHVRTRLDELLRRHAAAFDADPSRLALNLDDLELSDGPDALLKFQALLGDVDNLFESVRSPAQQALQPELDALMAAITGYVDHVMDSIGTTLIGSYNRLCEALRRRRVETDKASRLVARMLGLELDQHSYDRGAGFIDGILQRAGPEGLRRLFDHPSHLPTPAEVDAAGLWLARIDLMDRGSNPDG